MYVILLVFAGRENGFITSVFQKDSFCTPKGLLLHLKRTPFENALKSYCCATIYNIIRCRANARLQTERIIHLFYVNLKEKHISYVILCN